MDKPALRHLETAALTQGQHSAPSVTCFLIYVSNQIHFGCIYEWAAPFYIQFPESLEHQENTQNCVDPYKDRICFNVFL